MKHTLNTRLARAALQCEEPVLCTYRGLRCHIVRLVGNNAVLLRLADCDDETPSPVALSDVRISRETFEMLESMARETAAHTLPPQIAGLGVRR